MTADGRRALCMAQPTAYNVDWFAHQYVLAGSSANAPSRPPPVADVGMRNAAELLRPLRGADATR